MSRPPAFTVDILIPTSGRPHRQTTLKSFPEAHLIVYKDEIADYAFHDNVITCPSFHNIGKKRQWILENFGPKLVMMDDDLVFFARRADEPTKFRSASNEDLKMLTDLLEGFLSTYAHVSVSPREGANRDTYTVQHNTRPSRVLAYNKNIAVGKFDRLPVMEEFDYCLQLLTQGYSMLRMNMFVHNQFGSNTEGGCSQYRTLEVQAAAAEKLAEEWPRFVTAVEKTTKNAWGGATRKDVIIQWKRAYEYGRSR